MQEKILSVCPRCESEKIIGGIGNNTTFYCVQCENRFSAPKMIVLVNSEFLKNTIINKILSKIDVHGVHKKKSSDWRAGFLVALDHVNSLLCKSLVQANSPNKVFLHGEQTGEGEGLYSTSPVHNKKIAFCKKCGFKHIVIPEEVKK